MPRIELHRLTKAYALELAEAAHSLGRILFGRAVSKESRIKTAVVDVSLAIDSGERVGIIGPNGAGKSTLLHMIAGIGVPTSGSVVVDGKVTSILTLGIGLREELTGRANIYLDGELQGKSRAETEEVMDAIIAFAELGEFIDRPIRTYSTGMKSRLAFAMISHIDPEILLIDEALSVGDAAFSTKASRRIREICARGKIVVVVSHSLAAINDICTRCLWMDRGRIVMDGRPQEVTQAYAAAVHESDGKELLQRFRTFVGAEELIEGCAIDSLEMLGADEYSRSATFHADQGFTARIRATVGHAAGPVALRLLVERLDGLLLVDESMPVEPLFNPVDVWFPRALAHGVYKLTVEATVDGAPAARRSVVFEIVSENRPTGGRPALHYPYSISVESIPSPG